MIKKIKLRPNKSFVDWFENSGLTLAECGERMGVSHGHISFLLIGKRVPSFNLKEKIQRVTKKTVTIESWDHSAA